MTRVARGLGALLGLIVGLIGVPVALLLLGASVWPGSWSATAVVQALFRPDDGRVLAGLLTVLGWAAWAVFAASVLVEALQLFSRRRPRIAIPGLAAPQRVAAALLLAVIALVPTAPAAHGEPAAPARPSPAPNSPTANAPVPGSPAAAASIPDASIPDASTSSPSTSSPSTSRPSIPSAGRGSLPVGGSAADDGPSVPTATPPAAPSARAGVKQHRPAPGVVHRVREGDDLWTLAERYYGDGLQWRKIAKANRHVLTGGPDRLLPGWRLTIPGVATQDEHGEHRPSVSEPDRRSTTVRRGETLSSIADRELGSSARWPELFRANRSVLQDPDELEIGMSLVIPGAPSHHSTGTSGSGDRRAGGRAGEDRSNDGRADEVTPNRGRETIIDRAADEKARERAHQDGTNDNADDGTSRQTDSQTSQHHAGQDATSQHADDRTSRNEEDQSSQQAGQRADGGTSRRTDDRTSQQADNQAGQHTRDEATDGPDEAGSPDDRHAVDEDAATRAEGDDAAGADRRSEDQGPSASPSAAAEASDQAADQTRGRGAETPDGSRSQTTRPDDRRTADRPDPQHTADVPVPVSAADARQPSAGDITEATTRVPLGIYAGVGGLLAAGVIGGLAHRRRLQLQARPVGRRILHAEPDTVDAEVALGAVQRPLDVQAVDVAQRALATHCRETGTPVPELTLVTLDEESLVLRLDAGVSEPPLGFRPHRDGWQVGRGDAGYLASLPGLVDAMRPYPTLVELGRDHAGGRLLANLEQLGLLCLAGDSARATELLSAVAVELSFGPAADELILTIVGDRAGLPDALDRHNVTLTDDVDALLSRLEARARAQREEWPDGPAGHFRIDPDLSDPWAPEVILVRAQLRADQERRISDLVRLEPRSTVAVVVVGEIPEAPWTLVLPSDSDQLATLEPAQLELVPQRLSAAAEDAVVGLVAATGSLDTTPAPWWVDSGDPPGPPPDNIANLARRSAGWADIDTQNGRDMTQKPEIGRDTPPDHPVLLMLGPIELVGAAGELPTRAAKQCLEYCGWLLEHPGTTAQAMGAALLVAEGTRRSNMSRLRSWLGSGTDGKAYLPDAYSGRILLHAAVSSDWLRLQILTAGGVNRCSDNGLRSALDLVRGAPLADAAPGQWHWAEELRTDMISAVRDIGVELGRRANEAGELDLARWAAARALAAAPGDELLMATRIRTEHLAGNRAETERLSLQLAAQARSLGVDLDQATVQLLQEVMEGRVRARLA